MLVLLSNPAQAQTTSAGPYYATPSWDQTLPTATRWIILSNFNSEGVLDRNTGLVWEKSPATTTTVWTAARVACINKSVGGQKGWRLPAIPELASLIDPANSNPALSTGHPFLTPSAFYWSASTDAGNPISAWAVSFVDGVVSSFNKASTVRVWCVRGGMNADQY
jgi:hypothetical protein